ncbi:ErfK/YbiS/YcfS/YnhG family protein [Photobacterium marinum]|uniref:ErfK/YbiS/YcfS/YnhG family protein n=1 Tax=Photobacterium marinum TaxID=1056511 RepID=L8JB62_9GAMM|nr:MULTISPECIES: L,D-transpeptidase family protein [Photobacterium]ELR65493.1 ErfK/YbiS/YcfS/YnhG family protein [Photobacterium marinum]
MKTLLLSLLLVISQSVFAFSDRPTADYVLVKKAERKLFLIKNNQIFKEYNISLGKQPVGHKFKRGDYRTPEGVYEIDFRNRQSKFHLSLHINYPNQQDIERARMLGVDPGGDIFIHGLPNGKNKPLLYKGVDWTRGCIAVNNPQIREIAQFVPDGTPIQISP